MVHVTTTDISLALLLGPQLRAFRRAGWRVLGASAPGPYVDDLKAWDIDHVPLHHATRAWAPREDALALLELVGIFRRLRPDVVHTHNPKPGVYGRIAARGAGVKAIVNTVHGLYASPEDRARRRCAVYAIERLAATCSGAELVQNPEDLRTLARLGVPASKLELLGNGVDLDRFDPATTDAEGARRARHEMGVSDGQVLVGVVGRLVWEKGYRQIFDAARVLRRSNPEIRVVVVGPDEPEKVDAVDRGSRAAAERDGVRFLGSRRDMEALYAGFDIYALASYREGFPRAAMEAAAMGLPVVATDIRGCRQVVDDGRTGLLVPVRDAHRLAGAVATLAGDAGLRARMGRAGRTKALAEFDQRRIIDRTLATYERLISR